MKINRVILTVFSVVLAGFGIGSADFSFLAASLVLAAFAFAITNPK